MIARQWTGLCRKEKVFTYVRHLQQETFPQLRNIDGFIKADILHREVNDAVECTVITTWVSLEAIQQFTGENYRNAVVPENVREMLMSYDTEVKYYHLMDNN